MKIMLFMLLSFVLGSLSSILSPLCASERFIDGEELVYTVKWTGVPAGAITMKTKRLSSSKLKFELKAETNRFWSMVHKVRDVITSEVIESPFSSQVYYKNAKQGRRHIEEKAEMDYEALKVRRRKQNHSAKEQAYTELLDMPEGTTALQDPFSMIYYLRTFNFSDPSLLKQKFHVFASKGVYSINFKMLGESNFKSSIFGNRRVWNIEPSAEYEGSLVSKGRLELWVDCETGIPLRLMFHIPVGWATLELKTSNHPRLKSTSFRQRRRR
jgi:hypothetical protein